MTTARVPFATPRQAAYDVGVAAQKGLGKKLTHLPFNRFDDVLDETVWWLSPSSENPAYRHGKLVFTRLRDRQDESELFIGLYVERGLDPRWTKGPQAMNPQTWLWDEFMADVSNGNLDSTIDAICQESKMEATISIDASTTREDEDQLRYTVSGGQLALKTAATGYLQRLNSLVRVDDIPQALQVNTQPGAIWIDFLVGLTFVESGTSQWDSQKVSNNLCTHFEPWLR